MGWDGKNAVVTGGGRGLGRAIASVLAGHGAAVAVWDLNSAGAEETVAGIRETGGKALALTADVTDPGAVAAAAERTRAELGPITILVNNAGTSDYTPFAEMTLEQWDRMISINLRSQFLVTRAFVRDMLDVGWGRIVNISSSSAQTGSPSMSHYAAAKGGVIGFTKGLAIELVGTGITVNNVPPGFVDTPLLREGFDVDEVAKSLPMKRAGRPNDIAHAVAYLASDEAEYVTGQTLSVNGGRYLV